MSSRFAASQSPVSGAFPRLLLRLRGLHHHDLLDDICVRAGLLRLLGRDRVHGDRQPELVRLDAVAERDVAHDDLGHRDDAERGEPRHRELEHDPPALLGVGVAELELEAAFDGYGRVLVQHAEHPDLVARADLDRQVLRDERHEPSNSWAKMPGASSGEEAK